VRICVYRGGEGEPGTIPDEMCVWEGEGEGGWWCRGGHEWSVRLFRLTGLILCCYIISIGVVK
jgi:hypothetical protein